MGEARPWEEKTSEEGDGQDGEKHFEARVESKLRTTQDAGDASARGRMRVIVTEVGKTHRKLEAEDDRRRTRMSKSRGRS
jgi:hypothetical protein